MIHILVSVFCYDVWFYLSHLLLHTRRLWPIHREHHTKVEPEWQDTYVGHWSESVLQGLGMLVPMGFWSFTWTDIGIVLLFLNVRGMMRHDGRCNWLIGNHHLLHHKDPRYNFGEYWLDRLGGTLYPRREEAEAGWIYV